MKYGLDLMPEETFLRFDLVGRGRPQRGSIIRTAAEGRCLGGVLSVRDTDQGRWMTGSMMSLGPMLTTFRRQVGGPMEAVMADITAPSLRQWWREVDPWTIGAFVNHDDADSWGNVVSMALFDDGISGTVVADRTPAGDLALRLADEGPVGFSVAANLIRWHDGGTHQGLPLVIADEAQIVEISITPDPSDIDCYVARVGGEQAYWLRVEDAHDRAEILRRMR